MKKLFISCPMKGRTEENIRSSMERLHKIAEAYFDQKLEVIPTYIEDNPPVGPKESVWYLGESIKKMAEADYFIGVDGIYEVFKGCFIEWETARDYAIPYTLIDIEMMPDAEAIVKAYWASKRRSDLEPVIDD